MLSQNEMNEGLHVEIQFKESYSDLRLMHLVFQELFTGDSYKLSAAENREMNMVDLFMEIIVLLRRQTIETSAIKRIEEVDVTTLRTAQACLGKGPLRKDQGVEKGARHEVWGVGVGKYLA